MKTNSLVSTVVAALIANNVAAGQTTTPQVCLIGFQGLQFELFGFDNYPNYFREDSFIQLSQAGTYIGPDAIEEYVRFATSTSPFIANHDAKLGDTHSKE